MKKTIIFILVAMLTLSTTSSFAASQASLDKANKLHIVGMLQGDEFGNFNLDNRVSRVEAITMMVRLAGQERAAQNSNYNHPFTDVPDWAKKTVAYDYATGLTKGTSATTFGSNELINANQYTTFALRALNFSDSHGDFAWNTAVDAALNMQMITPSDYSKFMANAFTREYMVEISYATLNHTMKNKTDTLTDFLIAIGVITTSQAQQAGLTFNGNTPNPPIENGDPLTSEMMRVGLKYDTTAVSSCTLNSGTGFAIGNVGYKGKKFTDSTSLSIRVDNGAIVAKDASGTTVASNLTNSLYISGATMDTDIITIDSTQYRGGVMFVKTASNKITVINYIPLQQYLYGVIHNEMSQSYEMEALKAQAVLARSYAVKQTKHSSAGFDVCTTTNCQVYRGVSSEYPRTTQAVDETNGQKLYHNGAVIAGYYHANSGGHTQNNEDVWNGTPLSYLRGVRDEFSTVRHWNYTVTFDSLSTMLKNRGYNVGTIKSVQVTNRTASGHVRTLTVVGSAGTANIQREAARTLFGGNALSQKYYLGSFGSSDSAVTSSPLSIEGYGYGHGIGMPQNSAGEMAKQNYTYTQILQKYFQGVEVRS